VTEELTGPQMGRYAIAALVFTDEVRRAEEQIADVRADTLSRGSVDAHVSGLTWGALLALRRGDLPRAEADARAALELAGVHDVAGAKAWSAAFLAEVLLERDGVAEADSVLAWAPIDRVLDTTPGSHVLLARGRVRLAQGRTGEAIADLRAAGEHAIVDNPSFLPWRSALALALFAAEPDRARSVANEELALARWFAQPRGVGVALRMCWRLEGGKRGIAVLEEAVEWLRSCPSALELSRALYDLGAARRRCGQRSAARELLREALSLAQRCDAPMLAGQIHDELGATGAHVRRRRMSGPAALTPAERRVAELAASGLTNREIAQTLFVTVKTVGTHLGHIYEKLDLQGPQARERIGAIIGEGEPGVGRLNGARTLDRAQRG
jgi:DNA-binding CsgD family transcriptional regulator